MPQSSDTPENRAAFAPAKAPAPERAGRHAALVGAGIFLSRIVGLVRQRVFAHYLGSGVVAGIFSAALRIPNLLQNLLGEGILSSSFIPVYASLLARGDEEEANHVARAVLGLRWEPWLPPVDHDGRDRDRMVGFIPGFRSTVAPLAPANLRRRARAGSRRRG